MGVIRKYIWAIPLMGALVCLGALYTLYTDPLVYKGILDSDNQKRDLAICSIIIFLSVIVLIISSTMYGDQIDNRGLPIVWLIASFFILGAISGWLVAVENAMVSPISPIFWDYYNPGWGVYGMYIGAVFPIIGFIYAIIPEKRNEGKNVFSNT